MRRILALGLASFLLSSPALAEEVLFASKTCPMVYPCSILADMNASSPQFLKIAADANSCVTSKLGFQGVPFDVSRGLSTSKCLYPNPVPRAAQGYTKTPSCCLTEAGNNQCVLSCKVIGTK